MKQLTTNLINSIFKSDLLIFKTILSKQKLHLNIIEFHKIVSSIKQLVKVLDSNKKLPLFIVCQNKQYNILIKKYIIGNLKKDFGIYLLSYKSAVALKMPGVYFIIDCEDSNLLCTKIQQQSHSIIYLIEKSNKNKKYFGEYVLDLNIICIKQIIFILAIIKKIKNIYESL
jgi:hypothetical protein